MPENANRGKTHRAPLPSDDQEMRAIYREAKDEGRDLRGIRRAVRRGAITGGLGTAGGLIGGALGSSFGPVGTAAGMVAGATLLGGLGEAINYQLDRQDEGRREKQGE